MSNDEPRRPSPDALLEQAKDHARGKLKIYLGAAPGVGKTYEMLSDARKKRSDGIDVVAGVIESHGRVETKALCEGLEVLPKRAIAYRDQNLLEMDLDGLLARRPSIALVDELAHTNVEGSRHPKRWMDVEELLDAGIDVWTTLNIQHVESLNDIVARITRVRVRETVPDSVLEGAHEIELIDLTPDELIERLKEGKVYAPDQAQRALRHYFAPGNLSALRELAMRRAADQIDEQVREHRQAQGESAPWAAADRILVCIDDREEAAETVRHAKRLADRAKAQWIAAYVKTARHERMSEASRNKIAAAIRLATSLGATTATLTGDRVAETLLAYARDQNVTQIVVGKAKRPPLFEAFFGSVVRDLIAEAENIALYIIPEEARGAAKRRLGKMFIAPALSVRDILESVGLTLLATLAAYPLDALVGVSNLTLIYLAAVLASSLTRGVSAGLLTGLLSALAYNFFFTEPKLTFHMVDPENVLSLVAFSGAAIVVSTLASRARRQTVAARAEARTNQDMFDLARRLAAVAGEEEVARILAAHAARVFTAECVVFARVGVDDLRVAGASPESARLSEADLAAARWAFEKGDATGPGANTLPGARWYSAPMKTARLAAGVISIRRSGQLSPAERRRLDAIIDQGASALERAHIARAFEETRIDSETERLRATMLASLSHDLKTPIAGILGSASSLKAYGDRIDPASRQELLGAIESEAERIQRYVINLLDMTRLDAGGLKTRSEAIDVADIIAAVLERVKPLAGAAVDLKADVAPDLPLLKSDGALLHQALFNLVENAIMHGRSPAAEGGIVTVRGRASNGAITIDVVDRGRGLSPGEESRVFEKFYRGDGAAPGGTGLGLTIVKGFADAMGATVSARNQSGASGAVFTIAFPKEASAAVP